MRGANMEGLRPQHRLDGSCWLDDQKNTVSPVLQGGPSGPPLDISPPLGAYPSSAPPASHPAQREVVHA